MISPRRSPPVTLDTAQKRTMLAAMPKPAVPAPTPAAPSPGVETEDMVPESMFHTQRVVGLGGSAGSIGALRTFFERTPRDTGAAFVVILHLSPEHESTLAEVLQQATGMPVVQVTGPTPVQPDSVYVIPPAKHLSMVDGSLHLSDTVPERGRRVAVDLFFRSLADTHGPHAAAVVLSGADGDGAIGIKRIKERGGLTIAQDPAETEHEGMPREAIATGMIDWVLPVREMPARIARYWETERAIRLPRPEEPPAEPDSEADEDSRHEQALRDILTLLRNRTRRDFSYYKRATILRRIGRRMQVNDVLDPPAYLAFLRTHSGEAAALLQDLLISVTNFFRDKEAFAALGSALPQLFAGKGADDEVRVWVSGCATGEEAYSIAMLLREHADTLENPPALQVFATDIDEAAIQAAREGSYPETIAADVSEDRLRRFFSREHGRCRIRRDIRETVLFALHDLLRDSPFSRCDLVSCRNLLIYLNREAQARAMDIFHFALRPAGRLFLGTSEAVAEGGAEFTVLDKAHRLYQRQPNGRGSIALPAGPSLLAFDLRHRASLAAGDQAARGERERRLGPPQLSWGDLHFKLVERYAPPSIVVNQAYDIVHLSEHAGDFVELGGGEPTMNLLRVVHPMLRADLRTALFRAAQSGQPVAVEEVPLEKDGLRRAVTLRVMPAREMRANFLLVVFESRHQLPPAGETSPASAEPVLRHLEEELEHSRARLRETVEQSETSNEELKASNEELQAMNEELRSATEELETSREELQSINEELTTVNQELKSKIGEVSRANSDLQNLMASTAIATVFLDRQLRISRYTPAAVTLFNLIPTDIGRPLSDLHTQLDLPDLTAHADRVLADLREIESEARHEDGRCFHVRLLPYRTTEDQIAGVVLTLLDVTRRKAVEESLRQKEAVLQSDLEAMKLLQEISARFVRGEKLSSLLDAIGRAAGGVMSSALGDIHLLDPASGKPRMLAANGLPRNFLQALDAPAGWLRQGSGQRVVIDDVSRTGAVTEAERAVLAGHGIQALVAAPLATRGGRSLGVLCCYFPEAVRPPERDLRFFDLVARQAADAIERHQAENDLRRSREKLTSRESLLRLMIENALEYAIFATDDRRDVTYWNSGAERLLGWSEREILGQSIDVIFTPEDRAADAPGQEIMTAQAEGRAADERWHIRRDGSRFWASGSLMVMREESGEVAGFVKILRDQTAAREARQALEDSRSELWEALQENERARAEVEAASKAKDQFLAVLSHELRTPLTPVLMAVGTLDRLPDTPPMVREALGMIRRNIAIEAHFIDDLLDVTRITRGQLEIVREPVDLHELIGHAIGITQADLDSRRQTLETDLRAAEGALHGDRARLQQVFWNLLKNASKFSPDGETITLATANEDRHAVVRIADRGIGIDPAQLHRIFDPFTQENREVTKKHGGLGLGLAIAKATVDAHGGTLRAESAGPGRGSTFFVSLPLSGAEDREENDAPEAPGRDSP